MRHPAKNIAIKIIAVTVIIGLMTSCSKEQKQENNTGQKAQRSAINPPIPEMKTKFKKFSINAEKGDTIETETGTSIFIPPRLWSMIPVKSLKKKQRSNTANTTMLLMCFFQAFLWIIKATGENVRSKLPECSKFEEKKTERN
ncbi:MAG: hypothetical protein ABEH43_04045 [Flavobacteriales bacterium]